MSKYVCTVCGWVYDEEVAGTKFEDLPEDFQCELCGVGKELFEKED
ncbi:MAG: rubredoxin [Clostridia bacterium]|nr:rubredoxin [Clostridia bacterium]